MLQRIHIIFLSYSRLSAPGPWLLSPSPDSARLFSLVCIRTPETELSLLACLLKFLYPAPIGIYGRGTGQCRGELNRHCDADTSSDTCSPSTGASTSPRAAPPLK